MVTYHQLQCCIGNAIAVSFPHTFTVSRSSAKFCEFNFRHLFSEKMIDLFITCNSGVTFSDRIGLLNSGFWMSRPLSHLGLSNNNKWRWCVWMVAAYTDSHPESNGSAWASEGCRPANAEFAFVKRPLAAGLGLCDLAVITSKWPL